jgi:hypothetical protein
MAKSDDFSELPPKKEEVVEETPEIREYPSVVKEIPAKKIPPAVKEAPVGQPPMRKSLDKLVSKVYLKAVEAHDRIKICESCDKYLKNAKICGVCKCFMPMKTRLRMAKCPLDKW